MRNIFGKRVAKTTVVHFRGTGTIPRILPRHYTSIPFSFSLRPKLQGIRNSNPRTVLRAVRKLRTNVLQYPYIFLTNPIP